MRYVLGSFQTIIGWSLTGLLGWFLISYLHGFVGLQRRWSILIFWKGFIKKMKKKKQTRFQEKAREHIVFHHHHHHYSF